VIKEYSRKGKHRENELIKEFVSMKNLRLICAVVKRKSQEERRSLATETLKNHGKILTRTTNHGRRPIRTLQKDKPNQTHGDELSPMANTRQLLRGNLPFLISQVQMRNPAATRKKTATRNASEPNGEIGTLRQRTTRQKTTSSRTRRRTS
jgi:hypothetical protein